MAPAQGPTGDRGRSRFAVSVLALLGAAGAKRALDSLRVGEHVVELVDVSERAVAATLRKRRIAFVERANLLSMSQKRLEAGLQRGRIQHVPR